MFGLIKKVFMGLLINIVNASNHTKCATLSNQKCEIRPTLIDLHLMNTVKNFTTVHFQLN